MNICLENVTADRPLSVRQCRAPAAFYVEDSEGNKRYLCGSCVKYYQRHSSRFGAPRAVDERQTVVGAGATNE